MTVAVYGAKGFVGSAICAALTRRGVDFIPVVRGQMVEEPVAIVINAACPSQRLRAERDPMLDYYETVGKTADLYYNTTWRRFVQVSSLSARYPQNSVYGRHRLAAESIVKGLTIRLGPMYGEGLTKGVLVDMLRNQPVYADPDTRYSFAPVEWVGEEIADLALSPRLGLVETGGKGFVPLRVVRDHIGSRSEFRRSEFLPEREDQVLLTIEGPVSSWVLEWMSAQAAEQPRAH